MAIVKRSIRVGDGDSTAVGVSPKQKELMEGLELPTEASANVKKLTETSIFIHGEKKIGKSSLFAYGEPDSLFIEFDPIQPYKIKQVQVPTWNHMLAYANKLEALPKRNFQYPTIIIDRLDLMYQTCFDWVCLDQRVKYPPENDFGKVWKVIKREFQQMISRLMNMAPTRWICHSTLDVVEDRDKNPVNRLAPSLGKQVDDVFSGLPELTAAYMYRGKDRILVIVGDENIIAGHRLDTHFIAQDTKVPVIEIPMGKNGVEAYANFQRAYDNRQIGSTASSVPQTPNSVSKFRVKKGAAIT